MPYDANLVLQVAVSRSTTLSSTALTIGATQRRGLKARVTYKAADSTVSGSAVVAITLAASYDAGSTFATVASAPSISLAAPASQLGGQVFMPFEVSPTDPSKPVQLQLVTTISSLSGSGNTFAFQGDVVLGRPS